MGQDVRTDQVRSRSAEKLRGPAVHAHQLQLRVECYICVRRFFIKIAIPALALDQLLLDPQTLELGAGAGREYSEGE